MWQLSEMFDYEILEHVFSYLLTPFIKHENERLSCKQRIAKQHGSSDGLKELQSGMNEAYFKLTFTLEHQEPKRIWYTSAYAKWPASWMLRN